MSELIDRQAAIEAIEQMQMPIMRSEFPEEQFVFTGMSEALQAIKDLPAVQPEIIRCKDCKYYTSMWYCEAWNNSPGFPAVSDDMFCSLAERREDG